MPLCSGYASSELLAKYASYAAGCQLELELKEAGTDKLHTWWLLEQTIMVASAEGAAPTLRDPASTLHKLSGAIGVNGESLVSRALQCCQTSPHQC
jgi:hypothetical protein